MPIPLPNLDDRTYAELTAEARALIPNVLPGWTNHNPSDPGIVLVELLAWLTEMLLFQVDEIPEASTEGFLRLLNGRDWARPPGTSLDDAIFRTIGDLRERYRAVTVDDYEHLAMQVWPRTDEATAMGAAGRVVRVRAVPRRDLASTDPAVRSEPAPAHISLVVVPERGTGPGYPQPTAELLEALSSFYAARRTLTTRLHVVGPSYVDVGITASVALQEDAPAADAFEEVHRALVAFFDPLAGGPDGTGWPFGRDAYSSEVYATLEDVRLVNYVDLGTGWPFGRDAYSSEVYATLEDVRLVNYVDQLQLIGQRLITGDDGTVVGVGLDAQELVRLVTLDLAAYDVSGNRYEYRKDLR